MQKLTLQPNRPEIIALQFATGKTVTSGYGDYGEQVMYSLTDGRKLFLDPPVAAKIDELSLGKGEPFEVTKCVDRAKKVSYEVRYVASEPPPAQTQPAARPSVQTRPSSTAGQEVGIQTQNQTTNPQPTTTGGMLMACFLCAIDAVAEAQLYATRKGLGITFSSENVTSAALSAYIAQTRKEGR
jgi:hypothetical protein